MEADLAQGASRSWHRALLRAASASTRRRVVVLAAVAVLARAVVIAAAFTFAQSSARDAALLAVAGAGLYLVQRVLVGVSRIDVECDLHRAAARATLEGDVLDLPAADPHVTVFDGVYHATEWLVTGVPGLVASAAGALLAVQVLAVTFPGRVLGVGVAALVGLLAGAYAVRRATYALHRRALDAYGALADAASNVLAARVELVAHAAEGVALERLARTSTTYRSRAVRAALGAAALGRVPVALAVVAGVLSFAVVTGAHRDPARLAAGELALLAATLPSVVGVVTAIHELGPVGVRLRPFLALLARPRRVELGRVGSAAPLPAPIAFDAVTFAYDRVHEPVLVGASVTWPRGLLLLRGPNGTGKSTALRLVLGLRAPTSGALAIDGVSLDAIDVVALRRRLRYLPQRPHLGAAHATVREAMTMLGPVDDAAMRAALDDVGLGAALEGRGVDALEVPVGELSAGQRQRLALARVLAGSGEVILLDEPDANLDAEGVQRLGAIVGRLVGEGKMVAVAAHGADLAAEDATVWDVTTSAG